MSPCICGGSPWVRAIADTFAPGSVAAADHRRRGVSGLPSRRETSAAINSKLLVLDLCSDCKSFLPDTSAERTKIIRSSHFPTTATRDRLTA